MYIDSHNTFVGRRVFVTGATGFIGRHLVDALVHAGADVTILCRTGSGTAAKRESPVRTIFGNLGNLALLENNLRGQEIVFNLAYDGRASAVANMAAFNAILTVSANVGVSRIIHTSSIVVYDNWLNRDIDETDTMIRPGGGQYRQAKIEMENRLMAGTVPAAILQPTIVYGPGSALWTDQLAESLAAGSIVLPTPEGHCNGIFVDDLVQALFRAANVPNLCQERFIISGPKPFPWSILLEGYAQIIGAGTVQYEPINELKARLGPNKDDTSQNKGPASMAGIHAAGRKIFGRERFERWVRLIKRRLAKDGTMYPDHHLLGVFSATGNCSIQHARNRLGFEPEFDVSRGLAATVPHLKNLLDTV